MQVFLAEADRTPGLGERLRERLPSDDLTAITDAPPVSWLPVAINLRMTHAIMDLLGDDGAERFFHDLMLQDFEKPFLKPVVKMAVGLFGADVGSFVKLVPRGWGQIFEEAATPVAAGGGASFAFLEFRDVTDVLLSDDGRWARSVQWSFTSLFTVAKRTGTVKIEYVRPETCTIRYRFDWR